MQFVSDVASLLHVLVEMLIEMLLVMLLLDGLLLQRRQVTAVAGPRRLTPTEPEPISSPKPRRRAPVNAGLAGMRLRAEQLRLTRPPPVA